MDAHSVARQADSFTVTERFSPRDMITVRHRCYESRFDETAVGNDEAGFAVAYTVSDRRPQVLLPFGQSGDGPAAGDDLRIPREGVRPVPVFVVTDLGSGRFPCVPAHVNAVVDSEAHGDGRLHRPWDNARDHKGEPTRLLSQTTSEGDTVGREVGTATAL
jgi:hypothetical protein